MKRAFYFSYGPAAQDERLHARWPTLQGMDAVLRGYRLASAEPSAPSPTLVRDDRAAVTGRLYCVPAEALEQLEGAGATRPGLPTRRSVRDAAGRRRRAWIYLRPAAAPRRLDPARGQKAGFRENTEETR